MARPGSPFTPSMPFTSLSNASNEKLPSTLSRYLGGHEKRNVSGQGGDSDDARPLLATRGQGGGADRAGMRINERDQFVLASDDDDGDDDDEDKQSDGGRRSGELRDPLLGVQTR